MSERTAPFERNAYATQEREYLVAQVLGAREALVRVAPHTVSRVGAARLGEYVVVLHLQIVVHIVRVSVGQIYFAHGFNKRPTLCYLLKISNKLKNKYSLIPTAL